jgi:hypothetical protein
MHVPVSAGTSAAIEVPAQLCMSVWGCTYTQRIYVGTTCDNFLYGRFGTGYGRRFIEPSLKVTLYWIIAS